MARIRTIKPEFFTHEGLFDLEEETGLPIRLAFAGLWCQADREGRFKWEPRTLKLGVLPHDNVDFSRVLDALATRGFIVKYTCASRDYGVIPSWEKHQYVNNRETPSSLPEPNEINTLRRVPHACPTRAPHKERKGKERKGKGNNNLSSFHSDKLSPPVATDVAPAAEQKNKNKKNKPLDDPQTAYDGCNGDAIPARAIVPLCQHWGLPMEWGRYAESLGLHPPEIDREALKYSDYWVNGRGAGARKTIRGWRQSWSNWVSNATKNRR